jgi:hypothetical protein
MWSRSLLARAGVPARDVHASEAGKRSVPSGPRAGSGGSSAARHAMSRLPTASVRHIPLVSPSNVCTVPSLKRPIEQWNWTGLLVAGRTERTRSARGDAPQSEASDP